MRFEDDYDDMADYLAELERCFDLVMLDEILADVVKADADVENHKRLLRSIIWDVSP